MITAKLQFGGETPRISDSVDLVGRRRGHLGICISIKFLTNVEADHSEAYSKVYYTQHMCFCGRRGLGDKAVKENVAISVFILG